MENLIKCPEDGKTIVNNLVIDSADEGENLESTSLTYKWNEKITSGAITSRLRDQKKTNASIQKWLLDFPRS